MAETSRFQSAWSERISSDRKPGTPDSPATARTPQPTQPHRLARPSPALAQHHASGPTQRRRIVVSAPPAAPAGPSSHCGVVGYFRLHVIGRAHVLTAVTNAHLVCRLLLEKKK